MAKGDEIDKKDAEFIRIRELDNERRARVFYESDLPQDIIQEISNCAAQDAIRQFANCQMSTCEFVTRLLSIIRNSDMQLQMIQAQSGFSGMMGGGINATGGAIAAIAASNDDIEKLVLLKNIVTSMKYPLAPTGSFASDKKTIGELDPYMDKILKEIYTAISEIAKTKAEK